MSLRYTGIRLREVRYHAVGPCTERGGGLKRSNSKGVATYACPIREKSQ